MTKEEALERVTQSAHLEDWYHLQYPASMVAPGKKGGRLIGIVRDHPRLADGTNVHTSEVEEINEEQGWALTRNTVYTLGQKTSVG